jgi:hypothetical protein
MLFPIHVITLQKEYAAYSKPHTIKISAVEQPGGKSTKRVVKDPAQLQSITHYTERPGAKERHDFNNAPLGLSKIRLKAISLSKV